MEDVAATPSQYHYKDVAHVLDFVTRTIARHEVRGYPDTTVIKRYRGVLRSLRQFIKSTKAEPKAPAKKAAAPRKPRAKKAAAA